MGKYNVNERSSFQYDETTTHFWRIFHSTEEVAQWLGKKNSTIRRWKRQFGFPLIPLPNGEYYAHEYMIVQWFMQRYLHVYGRKGIYSKIQEGKAKRATE